jgi:hypothetical protein
MGTSVRPWLFPNLTRRRCWTEGGPCGTDLDQPISDPVQALAVVFASREAVKAGPLSSLFAHALPVHTRGILLPVLATRSLIPYAPVKVGLHPSLESDTSLLRSPSPLLVHKTGVSRAPNCVVDWGWCRRGGRNIQFLWWLWWLWWLWRLYDILAVVAAVLSLKPLKLCSHRYDVSKQSGQRVLQPPVLCEQTVRPARVDPARRTFLRS